MDFELGDNLAKIRDRAHAAARSVEPFAAVADASSLLDARILTALKASQLARLTVPLAYGGEAAVVDPLAICIVREQLAAVSAQLDSLFAMQGIGSYAISLAGSNEQRSTWLSGVGSLELLAALAITESQAGSDVRAIEASVVEVDSRMLLNADKTFISNGGIAAFYTALVREGDDLSLFLVPADRAGLSVTPSPELITPHILGDVTFREVRLTESDRIGRRGEGMRLAMSTLAVFRASVGAAAVGVAQQALDIANKHASTRHQFGKPLAALGAVAAMLADSWTEIEMARLLVYRSAWLARSDPLAALVQTSMAKLAATEAAGRVVDRCVQIMGRFGLIRDSPIERLYRQARPMRIYEGASEPLRVSIARALTRIDT